jgi:hypothetical protein
MHVLQEGANVTHIVGKLDGFLRKIADEREELANTDGPTTHTKLKQRIIEARKSLSEQGELATSQASL